MLDYRKDIDGLRAIAVLAVVGFHAFPGSISGGFAGVDIFFVISGYLITSIILSNLVQNQFSFLDFYSRRIRRIFPALILVLVAIGVAGWFLLLADEYAELGKHIAGGAGFLSNIVLWKETGYFDTAAETKPLLHLWSLGIEEQYYLLFPVLVWVIWKLRANIFLVVTLLAILSFILNIYFIEQKPSAVFYFPISRFWELMIGSLLAWLMLFKHEQLSTLGEALNHKLFNRTNKPITANIAAALGFLAIIYSYWFIDKEMVWPGYWAVLPTIGTALLILSGEQSVINKSLLSNSLLVWIGLISFPLYLWHWPLLSFLQIIEGEQPPVELRVLAVTVAVILAWYTYSLIEKRLRFGSFKTIKTAGLALTMIIVGGLGYTTYKTDGYLEARYSESDQSLLSAKIKKYSIDYTASRFPELDITRNKFDTTDSRKKILIIGDSYAKDLIHALYESGINRKIQLQTRHISHRCGNLLLETKLFRTNVKESDLFNCNKEWLIDDLLLLERIQQADEIWLASAWQGWQAELLPESIQTINSFTDSPIRVFGRKNFGQLRLREYLSVAEAQRDKIMNRVPEEQIRVNQIMKSTLHPPISFVDVQSLLCNTIQVERCSPFTKKRHLITYDGTHLTKHGAIFYGKKLHELHFVTALSATQEITTNLTP